MGAYTKWGAYLQKLFLGGNLFEWGGLIQGFTGVVSEIYFHYFLGGCQRFCPAKIRSIISELAIVSSATFFLVQ